MFGSLGWFALLTLVVIGLAAVCLLLVELRLKMVDTLDPMSPRRRCEDTDDKGRR